MDADPTTADGNRARALQLLSEGRLADAADAFDTARKLDPLNAERFFDLAEVLLRIADAEPLTTGDRLLGQAQALVERGLHIDRHSERAVALTEKIMRARAGDTAGTEPAPEPELRPEPSGPDVSRTGPSARPSIRRSFGHADRSGPDDA